MHPLDDLPSDSRREVTSAVAGVLGLSTKDSEAFVRASKPLWDAMEEAGGLVDSWGGGEFCYVFPTMCAILKSTDWPALRRLVVEIKPRRVKCVLPPRLFNPGGLQLVML